MQSTMLIPDPPQVAIAARSAGRHHAGFHRRQFDAGNRPAGDSHHAGDGDGIHLRRGRCLLGGAARAPTPWLPWDSPKRWSCWCSPSPWDLAMAATATVARRIGEHDPEGASVAAVQAIGVGVVLAILMGIARLHLRPAACWSSCTPPLPSFTTGTGYARIILGGNLAIVMIFLINGIFRGVGRRGHRDAHTVDGQPDQPGARPLLHLWAGPVPETWCDRRRGGHHHRPQPGCALSALCAGRRARPGCRRAPPPAPGLARDGAPVCA